MHSMDIRRKSPFTTPQLHCSKFSAHRNSILSLFPFCSLPGTSQIDLGCTLYKWMLCAGIQVKRRRRKEKRWQLLSCIKQLQGHNHASTVDLKFAQSIKVNKMKLFLKWKKKKVGQTVICCLEKQLKSRKMHFGGRNFRHPIILLCKRDFPAETSNTKAAQTTKPPRTSAPLSGGMALPWTPTWGNLSTALYVKRQHGFSSNGEQLNMVNEWDPRTFVCVSSQKEILPGICHNDAIQKAPRKVIIIHWTINAPAPGAGRHVIPAQYRDALL